MAMAVANNYRDMDYCTETSSTIQLVQEMVSGSRLQLHQRSCQYLSSKMRDAGNFLKGKSTSLVGITSNNDIRRKALRQLHFTVKRAETLVRGCCCEVESSWLESAVTLPQIKEDIVDILLDLRWWTSMVEVTIASVTWVTSGREIEVELLEVAEKDYQKLLKELKSPNNNLDEAFFEDKQQLLRRVRGVLSSNSGKSRDLNYLLATHVRTRLENTDLAQSMTNVDLNAHELAGFIGMGSFGAVMDVKWLNRSCALKVLNYKCMKEATSLSSFQHPHIVQFFRYWEGPVSSKSGKSTPFSTPIGSSTAMGSPSPPRVASVAPPGANLTAQSHILMEFLPTDLAKHMRQGATNAIPQDVAIDVMLQVTKAMWHLNNYNVAHRDLKPSNLLVKPMSPQEAPELAAHGYVRVKLGDFGLVSTKALSIVNTTLTRNMGTKIYGAPEVFTIGSPFPKKAPKFPRLADVWSFGIMLNEVLSGQPPFLVDPETNPMHELHPKIQKGLRPQLPENCPDYLKFCITNCWQLRPQDRPSFADLWKLMRFAQVRSLGIIREDHDLFTFTTREGVVKRLHKPKQSTPDKDPKSSSFWSMFLRIRFLFVRKLPTSHSVGCVVIEQLVVALKERAESFGSSKDDFEAHKAKVSRAFLTSLSGCFLYAPPYTGSVPGEDLLQFVFGGLKYLRAQFDDLCLTSPKLKKLSEGFMEARGEGVKLMALTEGAHTRGRVLVPRASMDDFKASGSRVEVLTDSNHSDTCKPVDKKHPAYQFLFEFIKEVLKGKGVEREYLPESSSEGASSGRKLTKKTTFKERFFPVTEMI